MMNFVLNILLFLSILPYNDTLFLPSSSGQQITHQYYSLSYNENTEQANWVYYKLTREMLAGDVTRSSNFRNDPLVTTKSASTADYTNSGYDRGHLCPAADMKFNDDAMYESFYLSNITPQLPGFNRGIWKKLEEEVRTWTQKVDSIYVVTGPIFDENDIRIGKNKVKVPAYFYKVLYAPLQNQMIAFVLPNETSSLPFVEFALTVDSLEELTEIDFFSQLPDEQENQLEGELVLSGWFDSPVAKTSETKKSNNLFLLFLILLFGITIFIIIQRKRNNQK